MPNLGGRLQKEEAVGWIIEQWLAVLALPPMVLDSYRWLYHRPAVWAWGNWWTSLNLSFFIFNMENHINTYLLGLQWGWNDIIYVMYSVLYQQYQVKRKLSFLRVGKPVIIHLYISSIKHSPWHKPMPHPRVGTKLSRLMGGWGWSRKGAIRRWDRTHRFTQNSRVLNALPKSLGARESF